MTRRVRTKPSECVAVAPSQLLGAPLSAAAVSALEPLHRFHAYCARFPSEVAESAIAEYTRPGDSIYDPFCGSGTSLSAGLVLRRRVVGSDIDVLAGMLSRVKCAPLSREAYARWRPKFEARIEKAFDTIVDRWPPARPPMPGVPLELADLTLSVPCFSELTYWFPPQLIAFLAAIAAEAHRCRDAHLRSVALVSLSAAIIAKWPATLSYAMDIDHTRPHRVVRRFTRAQVTGTFRRRLDRTIACLSGLRSAYEAAGVTSRLAALSRVMCPHDARRPAAQLEAKSQTLVVTSPPYFNAVDYPRAHRMSVCWMDGLAPADLTSRRDYVGLRRGADLDGEAWFKERPRLARFVPAAVHATGRTRRVAAFFDDLDASLRQIWRVSRPGGHAVIVIADNTVKGHRVESHAALAELARQIGFTEVLRRPRAIASVKRRFPVGPFGFDGPMTHEHVVVLRRPPVHSRSCRGRR